MGMVLDMKESKKESFFPAHIYPHKHSSSLSWLPSYNKTKLISQHFPMSESTTMTFWWGISCSSLSWD